MTANEGFKGLSVEDACDLANWQHFREVEQTAKKELIARNQAIYNSGFLDSIAEDMPKQSWSIVMDSSATVATLRSHLWPGYYAYHRSKTPIYGSVYIGNGMPNINLPFML